MNAPRSVRVEVNGWIVLDKPLGMTSTQAVTQLKRLYNAKKAGHAGTLDPLASGILPVAFGEATKTVPFVQDGRKWYRVTVKWGEETDSDDTSGKLAGTADLRPTAHEIEAVLPHFTGLIMQRPPAFSAIKVDGKRAYDLARDGLLLVLDERPVTIHRLTLVSADGDVAVLDVECGRGAYVRALARDLGRRLGCLGHVMALRRTRVGPFTMSVAANLDCLTAEAACAPMLPVEAGLAEVPCVIVDREAAARLRCGQAILVRGRDALVEGAAYAACAGVPVAVGAMRHGELVPSRVFNLAF